MENQIQADRNPNGQSLIQNGSLFGRQIEFHLARKPYSGIGNFDSKFQLETLNPAPTSNGHFGAGNKSTTAVTMATTQLPAKKSDGMNFGKSSLDPELSFSITFRRIGAGLENLGNTCFLNSVIQCLTYTEPLVAYLQSGRHQSSCQIAGFCALCAIQKHVSRALQSTGRSLAPKDLVSNLRCISRTFRNARQEDAHEYMRHLLESMHKCCLPKGVPSESPSAYEKSLVHKIFGGRLQSQVRCMECSYCSNKYDPFLDLSLEIAKADSLPKALGHFTAKEQLDGGAKQYQCQQCKKKVRAVKQLTVYEAPYVLTVHLKRFCAHDPRQKIDRKVVFSPTLDLKPFVSGPNEGNLMYTLYGVLVHAGWSTHSGHYYCFVRTSTGMWYSLDDNRVIQVSERTVLDQKAYMLFYVRDRKNVAPKKTSDVVLSKMREVTASGNNMLLTLTKSLRDVQNGASEKHGEGQPSVSAVKISTNLTEKIKVDVSAVGGLETPNSIELKDMVSKTVEVPPSLPLAGPALYKSGTLAQGSVASNEEKCPKEAVSISAPMLSSCIQHQLPENEKLFQAEKPSSIVGDGNSMFARVTHDSPRDKTEMNIPASGLAVPLSNSTASCKISGQLEAPGCKSMLVPKKNITKPVVITTRLSRILMCASSPRLCKKKLKRRRRSISVNTSSFQKLSEKLESTSEPYVASLATLTSKQRKKKSPSKEKHLELEKAELNCSETAFKTNTGGCNLIASSGDAVQGSKSNGYDTKHSSITGDIQVSSLQRGLKRGLEEPIVARWDGTISSNQNMVSMRSEGIRIGYVPDEWDEEYDRGRRKKVKLPKDIYDGTNPFQELAATITTSKKFTRDQSSSGNLPYRIP